MVRREAALPIKIAPTRVAQAASLLAACVGVYSQRELDAVDRALEAGAAAHLVDADLHAIGVFQDLAADAGVTRRRLSSRRAYVPLKSARFLEMIDTAGASHLGVADIGDRNAVDREVILAPVKSQDAVAQVYPMPAAAPWALMLIVPLTGPGAAGSVAAEAGENAAEVIASAPAATAVSMNVRVESIKEPPLQDKKQRTLNEQHSLLLQPITTASALRV